MFQIAIIALSLFACDTQAPNPATGELDHAVPAEGDAQPDRVEATRNGQAADLASHRVFFKSPADGATVQSPVKMQFGVEGMDVKAAGEVVAGSGHHHLIIASTGVPEGEIIPADETHIHFGLGQTEAEIELPPGEHTLTMQFANGAHVSYGEAMSTTIHITVAE